MLHKLGYNKSEGMNISFCLTNNILGISRQISFTLIFFFSLHFACVLLIFVTLFFVFATHNIHFRIFLPDFFFWWTKTTNVLAALHLIWNTHFHFTDSFNPPPPKRTGLFIHFVCVRFLLLVSTAAFSLSVANFCICWSARWKGFLRVLFFIPSHQHLMMFEFFSIYGIPYKLNLYQKLKRFLNKNATWIHKYCCCNMPKLCFGIEKSS